MSNEPKHTATPWTDDKFTPIPAGDDTLGLGIFRARPKVAVRVLSEENFQRAKQCVEACEGMSNEDLEVKVQIQLSNLAYKVDRNAQERDKAESELESIRAVNAELIEALRLGRNELERAKMSLIQSDYSEQSSTIQSINNALTTLAKYENKNG